MTSFPSIVSETSAELRRPGTMTRETKRSQQSSSSLKTLSQWLFDHQMSLSLHTVVPLLLAHVVAPAARPYTSPFLSLSYYNPRTGQYGVGPRDLCSVAFGVVLCIGIRAALMQQLLVPLGRSWGVAKRKNITRFAEQGWMLAYYSVAWPFGMYLYYHSPYYLDFQQLWTGWPQRELDGLVKVYVLAQWAYWIQQVIVVNIEARRKDYWEMIIHHAITISLIAASYAYHQARVGHLILVLMDVVELIFPLAKCLKYIGFTTLCDVVFGVFLFTWFLTRHIFYLMVCWSVYRDLPRIVTGPCYKGAAGNLQGPFAAPKQGWSHLIEPFHDPMGTVCFTDGIRRGFLVFLLALELVICAWSFFILCVAARVLKGGSAEDVRSDDDDEGQAEEVELVAMEVGVEAIGLTAAAARRRHTPQKSGLRLSSPSDRKEILNRIGCEKQID